MNERESILELLKQEEHTAQRQTLLKRLWKLEQRAKGTQVSRPGLEVQATSRTLERRTSTLQTEKLAR